MTISPPQPRVRQAEQIELSTWRRRNRRRRLLRVLIPVLALVVLAAGVWVVAFSSLLAVRSVGVSGAALVSEQQVRSQAAVPLGTPLVRLDTDAVADRVRRLREVESVSVQRSWPHGVRVTVVERTPVYAIPQDGAYLLVDRHGVGYRTTATASSDLPQVKVDPDTQSQLLQPLTQVVAALPQDLRRRVDRIEAPTRDSIQLRMTDGDTVFWGSEAESDLKAQVLTALLQRKGSHYDVSAPGNPAVR